MTLPAHEAVLCVVVHRGVLPFLPAWCASVAAQSDRAFDLCVALDGVAPEELPSLPGEGREVQFVHPAPGRSPAEVRNELFAAVVGAYKLIVAADADDLLAPERVAGARGGAARADLSACAMELIDHAGTPLGRRFCALADTSADALGRLLPRANVFGLSNTAWRAATLRACLPAPPGVVAVDWYLATAAWLRGARLAVDARPLMAYRQYADNTARVVPPFTPAVVRAAAAIVLGHQRAVVAELAPEAGARGAALRAALGVSERFAAVVLGDEARLAGYCAALARLPAPQAWWTIVADPALEEMWTP